MHRIDTTSATADNKFTDGNPLAGVEATVVDDDWLNDVQENICRLITNAGVPLTKGKDTDLYQAVLNLIAGNSVLSSGVVGTTWRLLVPFTDAGGTRRNFIIQGGVVTVVVPNGDGSQVIAPFTFGLAFPNAILGLFSGNNLGIDGSEVSESVVGFQQRSLTGATVQATRVAGSNDGTQQLAINYLAVGY